MTPPRRRRRGPARLDVPDLALTLPEALAPAPPRTPPEPTEGVPPDEVPDWAYDDPAYDEERARAFRAEAEAAIRATGVEPTEALIDDYAMGRLPQPRSRVTPGLTRAPTQEAIPPVTPDPRGTYAERVAYADEMVRRSEADVAAEEASRRAAAEAEAARARADAEERAYDERMAAVPDVVAGRSTPAGVATIKGGGRRKGPDETAVPPTPDEELAAALSPAPAPAPSLAPDLRLVPPTPPGPPVLRDVAPDVMPEAPASEPRRVDVNWGPEFERALNAPFPIPPTVPAEPSAPWPADMREPAPEAPPSPVPADREAALYSAAARLPPLGGGASVDLPVALNPSPMPTMGAPEPTASLAEPTMAVPSVGAPSVRGARVAPPAPAGPAPYTMSGGASLAPDDQLLVDALTGMPRGGGPWAEMDTRAETPLERNLRLNADMGRIEARRAENAGAAAAMERDRIAGELQARQEFEATRREAEGAARMSYRAASDRAAALRIDPDGFYHSRGVGGTIASAIAIGLGGLGAAISGGENVALSMINQEISRDLQAQQSAIESAWRRADAEGTLYDMVRQEFSSREAAMSAAQALAAEDVAMQVEEMASRLGSEEARVNAEALRGQLIDQAAAARAEAERAEYEWRLNMGLLEGRARLRMAEAQRAERRNAMAGGPTAPEYTDPMGREYYLDTANRMAETILSANPGMDPNAALRQALSTLGMDPNIAPAGAGRFAETTDAPTMAAVATVSRLASEIQSIIDSNPDDIPGIGLVDGNLDYSDEGRHMRQRIDALYNAYARMHSGAAVPASEEALFRRIISGYGTESDLREGLDIIRGEVEARTYRSTPTATATGTIDSLLGSDVEETDPMGAN